MAAPAILKIDVIADATKAISALGKTGDAAKGTGSKLGTLAKAGAALGGGAALISFGKGAIQAATDSGVATKRLDAVFKAMGDTTGEASKATQEYASALSAKIGVDDDAIMAAQAQLATFGAVSDETARTAGIFDRATAAAADLAAAGFGSLEGNSVQLGKALQDPVKGLSALSKSGVTFTAAQKDQIAAMQESGDLLGAQKVVLAAVEGQVKGTAEATVTSQDKMAVAFGETQEAVGGALLPILEKLAPVLAQVATFVQENVDWLLPLGAAIGVIVVAVKAWNIAQMILNSTLLANPIGLVVLAIGALIIAVIAIVRNWDKVKAALAAVFDWLKRNWPLILAILTGPFGLAVLAIVRNWDTIKAAARAVFDWLKGAATAAWRFVADQFAKVSDAITGVLRGVSDTAQRIADALTRPINAFIRGWNQIKVEIPSADPLGSFGPSIGGMTLRLPHIPELATGGSVLRTGMAIVHAGEQFSGVGRTFSGGGTVINVNVTHAGLGASSPQIQREVVAALRGWTSRNGALDVPVRSA